MKRIISSIIMPSILLTAFPAVYAESGDLVSSDKYSINNTVMCIYDIPYETTAEELKENIIISDSDASFSITDIEGEIKTGRIEDGDRVVVEADGEEYEYYLKTHIDGVGYSDDFNYRSYEEYKKITNALNKTGKSNVYAAEDNVFGEIVAKAGERVLKIAPKPAAIGMKQFNRFNFIQIEEISGKAVVEYDVWQKDLSTDAMWAYVNAVYSGVPEKPETGYALWGSNLRARGTLMRDDAAKARWLSFEGKQLIMEDERVYHVRQVLDFNGDIETYINGVKAKVTNEALTESLSKSMGNISGITSIGYGIYLDQNGDWRDNSDGYGVMWDNVKVYDPVKYAEFYIDLLPETDAAADLSVYENAKKAREVLDDLTVNAITESEISNLDKLLFWEEQFGSINVISEIYDVNNDNKTVNGILKGETVSEVFENINRIQGYSYEIVGKDDDDEVVTGDILKVTNFFDEAADFSLTADKDILVKGYILDDNTISEIPYNTAVNEFLKNISKAESTVADVYSDNVKNTYVVKDGDTLRVTFKDGVEINYSLNVEPGSSSAVLDGSGNIKVDTVNNVISGMDKGTALSELLASLEVSDRGTVKVYSKDGSEMINGTVNGTEIVKVFPEDPQPGAEFDTYTVSCNMIPIIEDDLIVTIEEEGFSCTGTLYASGSAVEPGYNGITTNYFTDGKGIFTPSIPKDGKYNVYIYTSYHSSNVPFPAVITHMGGNTNVTVPQEKESGWKLVGTYDFSAGTDAKVECSNTSGGGMARLSAVKFEKLGETVEITGAEVISGDKSIALKEGINDILKENIKFKFNAEIEIKAEDIKIISENANEVDFVFTSENGEYFVTPNYQLKNDVTYYVVIETDKLSKAYTYVLNSVEKEVCSIAEISFYNEEGTYVTGAADAAFAYANIRINNKTSEKLSAKLVICYYPVNGKLSNIVMEDIEVEANGDLKLNKQIEVDTPSETGKVRVFIWQTDFEPFGDVYYK